MTVDRKCSQVFDLLKECAGNSILTSAYIAGGFIYSLLQHAKPNDVDIYFRSVMGAKIVLTSFFTFKIIKEEKLNDEVTRLSLSDVKTKNLNIKLINFSDRAITFSLTKFPDYPIQFITSFIGEEEDVIKFFDFDHCCVSWTPTAINSEIKREFGRINYYRDSLKAIAEKSLIFSLDNTLYPISALYRLAKFSKRGFTVPIETVIKLSLLINKLNFSNEKEVIENLRPFYGSSIYDIEKIIQLSKDDNKININKMIELFNEK